MVKVCQLRAMVSCSQVSPVWPSLYIESPFMCAWAVYTLQLTMHICVSWCTSISIHKCMHAIPPTLVNVYALKCVWLQVCLYIDHVFVHLCFHLNTCVHNCAFVYCLSLCLCLCYKYRISQQSSCHGQVVIHLPVIDLLSQQFSQFSNLLVQHFQ